MTAKKSTSPTERPKSTPNTKPKGPVEATIGSTKDQDVERAKAKLMLHPAAAAAVASTEYLKSFGEPDVAALMHGLKESMAQVHEGNMKGAESMLIGQAHALQAIFMHLAGRSARCSTMKQTEMDMRLALKAQAQCCRTLEVLATMKNPPMILARQANVTTGPQQINNGTPTAGMSPACGDAKPIQNELLERNHVERLDAGAQSKASTGHPEMETMGAKHRAG